MMHGQRNIKGRRRLVRCHHYVLWDCNTFLREAAKILRKEGKTCHLAHGSTTATDWSAQAKPRTALNELLDGVSHPVIDPVKSSGVVKLIRQRSLLKVTPRYTVLFFFRVESPSMMAENRLIFYVIKVMVKVALEQAKKSQRESRGIALLFL